MPAVILAFLVGVSVGFYFGRRRPAAEPTTREPSALPSVGELKPNKRGRRVGLTEDDFKPSDDILERLRRAEAGEIDPADLHADEKPVPKKKPAKAKAKPVKLDPATMTDAERRVLDRLRQMEEGSGP